MGEKMTTKIPMLDLMFFLTETQDSPRHVGSVLIFKRPARSRPGLVQEIVDAYRTSTPAAPFNQVPVFPRVGLPYWQAVDGIDMNHHIFHLALPSPGSDEQLHQLIADLHGPMFERHRPGWKVYFIEGLRDNRFAIYHKVHHALVDGESGMEILRRSLSTSASDRKIPSTFGTRLSATRREVPEEMRSMLEKQARKLARQTKSVGLGSARVLQDAIEGLKGFSVRQKRAFTAPDTPMNRPIYNARSLTHRVFSLPAIKSVARAYGATLNDVALCMLDAGVQRYLSEMGESPDHPLVCLVPVSLRDAGADQATTQVSAIWPALGPVQAPIDQRLKAIMKSTAEAKAQLRDLGKDAAYAYAVVTFAVSETLAVASPGILGMRPANMLISNVRGSDKPLYLNGARLEALFPTSTLIVGLGLNVTLLSYDDKVILGFMANGAALPEIESLGNYTEEAFGDLRQSIIRKADKPRSRAKRSKAKKKPTRPRKKR